jgi:BirA family transcriptional regulator, biotin operon repressor / biotin---[acetyl-CoA-carboxylase] ligase
VTAVVGVPVLGVPRLHLRETDSTSARARELAAAGAPHGTTITAAAQTAGRGRQGRTWSAPPNRALLVSIVLRRWPRLLPLAAAVAVAEVVDEPARIKWPNDVLIGGRKVAGILVEARPQEGWAIVGIGINVAVRVEDLPAELHTTAAGLGLEPGDVERVLQRLLGALDHALELDAAAVLDRWRARDALKGRRIAWSGGAGTAAGIDGDGRLLVDRDGGEQVALDSGEVHLGTQAPGRR